MDDWLAALEGENYISLETFKKDGTGVKTPVWFVHDGDGLAFFTDSRSWKVKRLRRNDAVRLAACDVRGKVHGEWFEARAFRVEGGDARAVRRALTRKYWVLMRVGNAFATLTRRERHRAYYRIAAPSSEE